MVNRKKIAIICPKYPPYPGGVALYVEKLAKSLSAFFDIDIITSTLGPTLKESSNNNNFNVYYCIDNWKMPGFKKLNKMINEKKYDFINIQYMPHLYGYKGVNLILPLFLIFWRIKNKNIFVFFHEISLPFSFVHIKQAPFALLNRVNYFILIFTSKRIGLSANKWTMSLKRYFFWMKDKFLTIPVFSTLDRKELSPQQKNLIKASLNISESEIILLFLGYLHPSKLINYVFAALDCMVKNNHKVKLLCIGYETEKIPLMLDNGLVHLKDKVITLGTCPKEKIEEYLNLADIFLCPYSDGISERRTSAMAGLQFGLPVVTTCGVNTQNYLLKQNKNSFILAKNRKQFIKEIQNLIDDVALQEKLRKFSEEFYENNFSINRVVALYKKHLFTK